MRSRPAVIILAAAIALVVTAGPRLFLRGPGPATLPAKSDPARVEIRRPREDVVLEKRDGVWTVARQEDRADGEAIAALLEGLKNLDYSSVIAKGATAAHYGLGPADSVGVRVLDKKGILPFAGHFGSRVFDRSAHFRASERDGVLRQFIEENMRRGVPQEQFEVNKKELHESATRAAIARVKVQLLLARIAEEEKIKVEEKDLNQWLMREAMRSGQRPDKFAKELGKDREQLRDIQQQILCDKALDFVVAKASVKGNTPKA